MIWLKFHYAIFTNQLSLKIWFEEELQMEDEVGNTQITCSHQNLTLVRLINTDVYDE